MNLQLITAAASQVRTFYELVPLLPMTQWWHVLLLAAAFIVSVGLIITAYRFDGIELPRGISILLVILRSLAVVLLILFFLNPEKRTQQRIVKHSRLPVLIDTSLSMGLRDVDPESRQRRVDQVLEQLEQGQWIHQLRQQHDVTLYRFDESTRPIEVASYTKQTAQALEPNTSRSAELRQETLLAQSRWLVGVAALLLVMSLIISSASGVIRWLRRSRDAAAWWLMAGMLLLVGAAVILAVADLHSVRVGLPAIVGLKPVESNRNPVQPTAPPDAEESEPETIDWKEAFRPQGVATRLGEALKYIVNKERGGPIAGIIVITDGQKNIGADTGATIALAREAGIPIFPIGLGSAQQPRNVKVAELTGPQRVFPEDKFQIKGLLQPFGLADQLVKVELVSVDQQQTEAERFEAEASVRLGEDGVLVPIEFELASQRQGKRIYQLRVIELQDDLDPQDNQRSITVEIIDRKHRVLLMAGGPTREFRFLRNQLYRDPDTTLDVYLQTARPGVAQESNQLLFEFPNSKETLFQYDCLIAFDPDWRKLTEHQSQLLDQWVAEQAGGLIVVAGPVFTPEWTRRDRGDPIIDVIRRLYPVSFFSQSSASIKLGRFGGEEAFPLEFTRQGRAATFLRLKDSGAQSRDAWDQFGGVYGYYAVSEPRRGAEVYARFSDPETAIGDELPIYLAGHFYGAGRVFFQASGEMWRLRAEDVEFFEQYYTKLIRWVSQGRLLRDSTRGILLLDRESCWLGDQVTVQAVLKDAQDRPLEIPEVSSVVLMPDGTTETLVLRAVQQSARKGTYAASLVTSQDGDYRISLPIPDSPDHEVLVRQLSVQIPDLELRKPQRNDSLLAQVAEQTDGHYFIGFGESNTGADPTPTLGQRIEPRDQETYLPGTPLRIFSQRLMMWLLGLLVGVLCLEWILRRLNKLA